VRLPKAGREEAGFLDGLLGVALGPESRYEPLPARVGPEAHRPDVAHGIATISEEVPYGSIIGIFEPFPKDGLSILQDRGPGHHGLMTGPGLGRFLQLHPGLLGQAPEGLLEVQASPLSEIVNPIPALAALPALPDGGLAVVREVALLVLFAERAEGQRLLAVLALLRLGEIIEELVLVALGQEPIVNCFHVPHLLCLRDRILPYLHERIHPSVILSYRLAIIMA